MAGAAEGRLTLEEKILDDRGIPQPTGNLEPAAADLLVLAIGRQVDLCLAERLTGVEVVGGDMVPSPRTMTAAVGHGKRAARRIDAWLRGSAHQPGPILDPVRRQSGFEEVLGNLRARSGARVSARAVRRPGRKPLLATGPQRSSGCAVEARRGGCRKEAMGDGNSGRVRLSDVLEPLLNATEADDVELEQAVGLVAEALAALGILIIEQNGQPAAGATDEKAVLAALNTYARMLVRLGRMDEAIEVTQLMRRIGRLGRPRRGRAVDG